MVCVFSALPFSYQVIWTRCMETVSHRQTCEDILRKWLQTQCNHPDGVRIHCQGQEAPWPGKKLEKSIVDWFHLKSWGRQGDFLHAHVIQLRCPKIDKGGWNVWTSPFVCKWKPIVVFDKFRKVSLVWVRVEVFFVCLNRGYLLKGR